MSSNMYNPEVFAVLTAYDQKNKASSAFKLPHNSKWFRPAAGGVAERPIINSREATPAEDSQSEDEGASAVDRLVLPFSKLMQLENVSDGIQAGTSTISSHILLGHRGIQGISSRQYNIAVDENLCIWLHDYHSTHGTAVESNGQNQKVARRKETWILAYKPGNRNVLGDITIYSGGMITKIEFPNQAKRIPDSQYVTNLRAFADMCKGKDGVAPNQGLGLDNEPPTEPPSEAQTLTERLIYYKEREIGKGSFGVVHRLIRARDGKFFAAKTFESPANDRKRRREEARGG
ncbi:hypothetical protein MMC19_001574 [Ptychographa xylographoides]|nr:hypothetical protein [Ptychographa xylographoides]